MYMVYVENMLTSHRTKLRFDDYLSDWFPLDNGIGQGDPLLMVLYLCYNADILEVPSGKCEMGLGYVDDVAFVAAASSFSKAHKLLESMMRCPGGGNYWTIAHNSKFELSNLILVDFSWSKTIEHPPVRLAGMLIWLQVALKFIGVDLDQGLRWN